jgi:hypothetical protein
MNVMARVAAGESDHLKQTAFRHVDRSELWGSVSLALILLAGLCWAAAHHLDEHGPHGFVLTLFLFYIVLMFLIV